MTANDTKKALQIHINMGDCKECPYVKFPIGNCEREMHKDALNLIEQNEKGGKNNDR